MSDEDLRGELERLKQENAALRERRRSTLALKISEKGGEQNPRTGLNVVRRKLCL